MKKITSLALSLILVTGFLFAPSCSKKQLDFSSCDWYSSETFTLSSHEDDFITMRYSDDSCVCGDKLYIAVTTDYFSKEKIEAFDNGSDILTFDDHIQVNELMEYDVNTGKLLNSLSYQDSLKEFYPEIDDPELITICGMLPHENKLNLYLQVMDQEISFDRITFDTKSKKFSDCEKGIFTLDQFSDDYLEQITRVGDKDIARVYCNDTGKNSYKFYIIDGTDTDVVRISDTVNENISSMENYIVDDDKLIVITEIFDFGGSHKALVEIDIDTGEVSFSNDLGKLSSVSNTYIVNGDESYSILPEGIYKYNTEKDEMEKQVDFNFSDINYYDASHSSIVSSTDSRIVLLESKRDNLSLLNGIVDNQIHVITGSDNNPHDGKQKIVVANMGDELDYATAEAISKFNKENPDYYIELRVYHDDASLSGLYSLTDISNRVMIDIKNGDAPDVILNGAAYTELNSAEYLVDLSTYISNDSDFNLSDYYENIIQAAATGDKLYQIPVTTNLYGIRTLASDNDDYSFAYDEYSKYTDSVLNGFDPIYEKVGFDKQQYMNELLSSHLFSFIDYETKQVDFNKDEFIEAAEYVKNLYEVPENSYEEILYFEPFLSREDTYYGEIHPFDFYRTIEHLESDIKINDVPYSDSANCGAKVQIESSVAISADSENADGAWQFVKVLLSDEIQSLVDFISTPVNKAGLDAHIARIVEENNLEIGIMIYAACGNSYPGMMDDATLAEIDDNDILSFKSNYESVNNIRSNDAEILIIIDEEIAPYFAGQKSLDEVIPLINNRVSTLINERN